MAAKKVRFVKAKITHLPPRNGKPVTHAVGIDTKGRIWERYSDMPLGVWGLVDGPDEPARDPRPKR